IQSFFAFNRILCKFFVHGSCLKGENCEYSHDSKHHANNVCTFYQKGICSYGTRCRYEHVRTSQKRDGDHHKALTLCYTHPREHPICSFAAAGDCPRGSQCPHMHGDVCSTCGKKCLHPFRPEEREEHTKECEKKQKHIEALKKSQEIECSVCLDRVLSKATPGERKFGLLTECHHPFCIQCIRNWRSSAPVSGMDVNSTLRACPICRKLSYFVVPSVVWYSSPEEKKEIIDVYKAKLSTSTLHAYTDGNLEEVVVRHLGSQEGETVIADSVAGLSEFLGRVHL
ncbi:hypothetical protein HID58_011104, partial [Brassica napus]